MLLDIVFIIIALFALFPCSSSSSLSSSPLLLLLVNEDKPPMIANEDYDDYENDSADDGDPPLTFCFRFHNSRFDLPKSCFHPTFQHVMLPYMMSFLGFSETMCHES